MLDAEGKHRRGQRRRGLRLALVTAFCIFGVAHVPDAFAAPRVPAGFAIAKVAAAPPGAGSCDDLAFLDGKLFMGCQNAALSGGGGGNSTLVELALNGTISKTWSIKDKIDGLGSDPLHHRVIVTLNEDSHSHLVTVSPSATGSQQITSYTYSPDIGSSSSPPALNTGGGTDNVSVDALGNILFTASHAKTKTGTAVFRVTLSPPSSPIGTGTATLAPTFADAATAAKGNGGGSVKLALTDVDSGAIVPSTSPRFPGAYVIDDQTALELVFANNIFTGTGLTVMKTPYGLDDLKWATSGGGTLYVVDFGAGTPGKSAVYKITGPFVKNTVFASNDSLSDQVVKVNLATGALTPFVRGLNVTKGLVYLDPTGTETQLSLTGGQKPASSSIGTTNSPKKASTGSSNTALIIIIVAAVLALGAGGYTLMRRRAAAG
jgi:hypothetical protein